jgi:hypothetical protein
MKPEENLRLYCSKATLQEIPPPPDVSLPHPGEFSGGLDLYTMADPRRDLSYIYSVGDVFDQRVLDCTYPLSTHFLVSDHRLTLRIGLRPSICTR